MLYFGRMKAVIKLADTCSIVISVPVYMCVDGEQGYCTLLYLDSRFMLLLCSEVVDYCSRGYYKRFYIYCCCS